MGHLGEENKQRQDKEQLVDLCTEGERPCAGMQLFIWRQTSDTGLMFLFYLKSCSVSNRSVGVVGLSCMNSLFK